MKRLLRFLLTLSVATQAVFVAGLPAKAQLREPILSLNGEQFVDRAAAIEANADLALRLPTTTPLEILDEKLTAQLQKIKQLVDSEPDAKLQRHGITIYANVLRKLGRLKDAQQYLNNVMPKKFSSCSSFIDCLELSKKLSALIEVSPDLVRKVVLDLAKQIEGLTHKMTLTWPNPIGNSLLQRLTLYRVRSLGTQALFFEAAKITDPNYSGLTPKPSAEFEKLIYQELSELKGEGEELLSDIESYGDGNSSPASFCDRCEQILGALVKDVVEIEFSSKISADIAENLVISILKSSREAKLANSSLEIYLTRPRGTDASYWLKTLAVQIQKREVSLDSVLVMLSRFSEIEAALPSRKAWVAELKNLSKLSSTPTIWSPAISIGEIFVSKQETLNQARLDELKFNVGFKKEVQNSLGMRFSKKISGVLLANETELSRMPGFFSITFQLNQLQKSFEAYFKMAQKEPQSDDKLPLISAHDAYVTHWLQMAVYAAKKLNEKGIKKSINVPHSDGHEFDLSQVVYKSNDRHLYSDISDLVSEHRRSALLTPVYLETLLNLATIPLTVFSGGVAGALSRPVAAITFRIALGTTVEVAQVALARQIAAHAISRVSSAIVGASTFTAVQKLGLWTLTLGHAKIYDSKKTLFQNYGREILFGTTIFLFLPFTSGFIEKVAEKSIQRIGENQLLLKKLLPFGVKTVGDILVFTSLGYAERVVSKRLDKSKDPVVRGWVDFMQQLGHSAAIALAFRMHEI